MIVVGAGLLGTSLAWRLAERGLQVELLDAADAGTGTSGTSFAWLNANNKQPKAYFDLNVAGMDAHRRLVSDDPTADWAHFTGHLQWASTEIDVAALTAKADRLRSWGYAVDELTRADARALEPDLVLDDVREPVFLFPREGFVYPRVLLGYLLRRAVAAGVTCRFGQPVTAIDRTAGGRRQVRLGDGTTLETDVVALAAGRWTGELTRMVEAEIPLVVPALGSVSVGYLAYTAPMTATVRHVVSAPDLSLRPDGGGRVVLQALDLDVSAEPGAQPDREGELGRRFLERLRARLHGTASTRLEDIRVGIRPLPLDGLPAVGWLDEAATVYVVVTHSGVTLGVHLGSVGAAEIATGQTAAELDPFRPARLLGSAVAR